ncbi:hypothetical protein J6590_032664 [Homalodisca vitripennis]|nr:hypothetical protein J6590_032664 [Homalodisca vitripennis]
MPQSINVEVGEPKLKLFVPDPRRCLSHGVRAKCTSPQNSADERDVFGPDPGRKGVQTGQQTNGRAIFTRRWGDWTTSKASLALP